MVTLNIVHVDVPEEAGKGCWRDILLLCGVPQLFGRDLCILLVDGSRVVGTFGKEILLLDLRFLGNFRNIGGIDLLVRGNLRRGGL